MNMRELYDRRVVSLRRLLGLFFRVLALLKREGIKNTVLIVRRRLALDKVVSGALRDQEQEDILPLVSIIIPVFNALSLTRECIRSLLQENKGISSYEIIVVDNASTDGTPAWLEEECRGNSLLRVFTMRENLGFGPAVNIGMKSCKGEYFVILNNDTIVSRNWLRYLIEGMERDASIGILSPVTNYVGEGRQLDESAKAIPPDVKSINHYAEEISGRSELVYEPNRLVFFCVMMRRELIDLIGGLDEGYEKGNFEDDDYCLRARMAGFRLGIARNAFVYHHGSATFKSNRISHSRHMETNRVRFYKKAGRIAVSERGFSSTGSVESIKISVILRTKDRPHLLRRALASLTNQTFKGFETVLVNDGGGDISGIVDSFATRIPIIHISNEIPKGRTAAINSGWQQSKGSWICFLDDDDILYPWHLETLFHATGNGSRKFVYGDYNRALFLDEKKTTPDILTGALSWEYSREELLVKNNIPIHTWLYARECAERIGQWDESLDRMEDYDFLLRLSAQYPLYHVRKVTCEYRYYVNSSNSIYTERHKTLESYKNIFQRYPVDSYVLRVRRQEVLDMIHTQTTKIAKIEEQIGADFSRQQANRDIIRLVTGL